MYNDTECYSDGWTYSIIKLLFHNDIPLCLFPLQILG